MDFIWSTKGSILLFPAAENRTGPGKSSCRHFDAVENESVCLSWYEIPCIQRFLNESHAIFSHLQSQSDVSELDAPALQLFSRQYYSCLRCLCLSLSQYVPPPDAPVDSSQVHALLQVYRSAGVVWSLAELLFVTSQDPPISLGLVNWSRHNFNNVDAMAEEIIESGSDRPEEHPLFWNAIYLYVLFGRCEEARQLLQLDPRRAQSAFTSVDELLRKIPFESLESGDGSQWENWQQEVGRRLEENHFVEQPDLEIVVRILSGEGAVISDAIGSLLESWYQAMVPIVLYRFPTAKVFDLQEYIGDAMKLCQMDSTSQLTGLDRTLMALFETEVVRALKEFSTVSPDWWLAAHLSDLLYKAGCDDLKIKYSQLDLKQTLVPADAIDLREFLILDYANTLMTHKSLWQVGVNYLNSCPGRGSRMLEIFIERMPLDSDYKATKLLRICREHGLNETARTICRETAVNALKNNNITVALTWCLQSKDPSLMSLVAERVLLEFSNKGGSLLQGIHLLDQLGDAALSSAPLLFLGKYRQFQQMRDKGENKRAADILVQLLKSRLGPRELWTTLLKDATQLMSCPDRHTVFDRDATYQLMELLTAIQVEMDVICGKQFAQSEGQRELLLEQIKQFRIQLVRNFARF